MTKKKTVKTRAASEKETVNVTISFTLRTEFEAYEKNSVNKRIVKDIEKHILYTLRNDLSHIPFYDNNSEAASTSACRISIDQVYTS